jgi:hypothetical protein
VPDGVIVDDAARRATFSVVAAELDDARPRYLHRDPSRNYTHEAWRSVLEEGEAVSPAEQRRQSQLARRVWARRRQDAFRECDERVGSALADLLDVVGADHQVESSARAVKRCMQALGKRVIASS